MIREGADLIFLVGIILAVAYAGGKVSKRFKFPEVTGYIIAGIVLKYILESLGLIGPDRLEFLLSDVLGPIPEVTLSLIAFVIGGSLPIDQLRRLGKGIALIGLAEGFGAFVCVAGSIFLLAPLVWRIPCREPVGAVYAGAAFALLLGAFSSATAPAATVAVIRELRARGDFTTTLLGVVGFDDAVALFIFTFASTTAAQLASPGVRKATFAPGVLGAPFVILILSAALGAAMGCCVHLIARSFRGKREASVAGLGLVLLSGGVAMALGLSPLFANMFCGFTLINLSRTNQRVFRSIEEIDAPIFALFFTLAGTHLDFQNLSRLGILGAIYFSARLAGKLVGVKVGSAAARASTAVGRYLALGLCPQAGVAIGLVLIAQKNPAFSAFAPMMTNIVLGTVAINEIVGPPLTAYALRRAGDVRVSGRG